MPPIEVERLLEDQRTRTKWNRFTPFIVRFLSLYFALRNVYVFRLTIQHPHLVVSIGSGSIYSECYRSIYSIKESNRIICKRKCKCFIQIYIILRVQSFYLNENVRLCVSALYANGSANTSSSDLHNFEGRKYSERRPFVMTSETEVSVNLNGKVQRSYRC